MIPFSPSKRRKSNSSIPIPVGEPKPAKEGGYGRARGSRSPSRLSFRAPTRSSLARHHPDVLSRVLERSASEKARRQSGQDTGFTSEHYNGSSRISGSMPLRPSPAKAQLAQETEEDGLPRLSSTVSIPSSRRRSFGEISLVDNSTQHAGSKKSLSVSPAVDDGGIGSPLAPPGLGQNSFLGRTVVQSNGSPKKIKPRIPNYSAEREDVDTLSLDDAEVEVDSEERLSEESNQKRVTRDSLKAQLERLKGEVALLEMETGRMDAMQHEAHDEASMRRLIELLLSKNPSCAPPPPKPPAPPSLSCMLSYLLPFNIQKYIPQIVPDSPPSPPPQNPYALSLPLNSAPYLTIFAPLTLKTETIISTARSSSRNSESPSEIVQIYRFILQPPAGFPASLYHLPLTLTTDLEKQSVIFISVPTNEDSESMHIPTRLKSWIASRLSNPLFDHDISGLCWGICRYWEAAISLSKFWIQLQELSKKLEENPQHLMQASKRHRKQTGDNSKSTTPQPPTTDEHRYTIKALVRHFDQATYRFSTTAGPHSLELLVSCHLSLDLWTSEPQLEPDICISSSSLQSAAASKIEKETKKAFRGMLKHSRNGDTDDIGSLINAVQAVIVILFGLV